MDVMLWLLIGLAGGLTVAALAPQMRLPTRSAAAPSRVRGMATGLVGAVAARSALLLAAPAVRADRLTAGVLALAGALWLASIVDAYSSRRRRGEGGRPPAVEHGGAVSAIAIPAHDAMRQALVDGLIEDALAHEAGRYAEIGRQFPAARDRASRQGVPSNSRLQLASRFWHRSTQACDERWPASQAEQPVSMEDWARYARTIAFALALDRDTMAPAIVSRFAYVTDRGESLG